MEDALILLKSNINYHLERLIFGQQKGFSCWKDACATLHNCEECSEPGLVKEQDSSHYVVAP